MSRVPPPRESEPHGQLQAHERTVIEVDPVVSPVPVTVAFIEEAVERIAAGKSQRDILCGLPCEPRLQTFLSVLQRIVLVRPIVTKPAATRPIEGTEQGPLGADVIRGLGMQMARQQVTSIQR